MHRFYTRDESVRAACLRIGMLRRTMIGLIPLLLLVATGGCKRDKEAGAQASTPEPQAAKQFSDVAEPAGISHVHHKPSLDRKLANIDSWVCSVGAAAAAGDYNNDGWIDLYVTDSHKGTANFLYHNNGDGTFTDVARKAGIAYLNGDQGTSMDAIWGDYNNDGWIDLYVVRWGPDVLMRNNRDGTFTDVTAMRFTRRDGSPGTEWANGNAAIFFDYNLDGRLDIYVGNYFREMDLWNLDTTRIMHDGFETSRNGSKNFLYRQEPDGSFVEVAESLGLDDPGWTLAVGSADINNDGWPDLYCADDFGPDQLFLNRGDGSFRNATEHAIGFDTKKGMNVDFGDFNNDGWLDIYVANITTSEYLQEGNMLWHNNGPDKDGEITLTDISLETGTYDGGWGWGAKFFDYDNDGDLDIIAANGFISAGEGNYWYDLASWTVTGSESADAANWPAIGDRSFSGYEPTRVWRNDGMYSFSQRAKELGIESDRDGRGVVVFDYDNDSDIDVFVANQDAAPHLYRNSGTANHSLVVRLEANPKTGINRDAIGTRVTVMTSNGTQVRERDGGNGYSGQSDPRLHFGIGQDESVPLVEVRWPDGGLQYLEDVPADQIVTVKQDPAKYADRVAITIAAPKPWVREDEGKERAIPSIDPEEMDRQLSQMEEALRGNLNTYALASEYRRRCAEHDRHERSIRFFEQQVSERPDDVRARIELASAYIDKIPTCGGIAAVVSKGTLARKSLDQLDFVIRKVPDSWVAYYCRAMNHLHWPRALRHSDDSVADFNRCIQLQEKKSESPRPFDVRTYIGLGDAHTKAKEYELGRTVWERGLELFPDSEKLKARLAVRGDGAQLDYVEAQRNLEQPIDTSLAFLDGK